MTTMHASAALLTLFSEHDLRPTRRAVKEIAESLPFDRRQVADITLAVAEACINGVRHGGASADAAPEPVVFVVTEPAEDHLRIDVEDRGAGFEIQPPAMPGTSAESGRGIALMHALMDDVAITSNRCGTHVRMIKYFSR